MLVLALKKGILEKIFSNGLIKLIIIGFLALSYFFTIGHVHANPSFASLSGSSTSSVIPGVCVFDIDYTLNCDGAIAAVQKCKEAGFALAINTARNKQRAYQIIKDGTLKAKGFDQSFIDLALNQQDLNGPFQYSAGLSTDQTFEQTVQGKSYAMRNIAKFYGLKLDDIESRRIILFDDTITNIYQVQPIFSDVEGTCYKKQNGECYDNVYHSPYYVSYPRNWKIYRGKWIGAFCEYWNNPVNAEYDASAMIEEIIYNYPRE
jgi:hypothetical protein